MADVKILNNLSGENTSKTHELRFWMLKR